VQFHAPTPSDGFEPWELDTANAVVRSHLRVRGQLRDKELEQNLIQECLLQWWLKRDRYDSTRGANRRTFMNKVCENHLRGLARRANTQRRGRGRQPLSLDVPLNEGGDLLADLYPGASPAPDREVEVLDLARQVERFRRRLSQRQREVLNGRLEGRSNVDLAREIGVSRDTVHEDIKRIQKVARDERNLSTCMRHPGSVITERLSPSVRGG
jgi:RNA polymerase sigma factor (sigma-70 family)